MDDFAVDLDKVLDDFELSEGGSSGPKSEPKNNHGNSLPALQPAASAGSLYSSPQVAPLPPSYSQNNPSNPGYRQHPTFNTQFDITYQQQPHKGDHSVPQQNHNSVIHATVQPDSCGDVISTSKTTTPNAQLDLMDRLSQTSIPCMEPQLNDISSQQWSTVVGNNNMTPYAVKYGTDGGVLAHGERSNGNILRRLSDDRPELLQSMEGKPVSQPPYLGNVSTSQGYPGGTVVSHARPDVVPVSMNNSLDIVHRPMGLELQKDLGVNCNCPNEQVDSSTASATQESVCQSNGDHLLPFSSQQETVLNSLQPGGTKEDPGQQDTPEDMNVDSPPHSLQGEQGNSTDRTTESASVPSLGVPSAGDIQADSPMCLQQSSSSSQPAEPEMVSQNQCKDSSCTQEQSVAEMITADSPQPPEPVGFGNIEEDDIDDDINDLDEYLASMEAANSERKINPPKELKSSMGVGSIQLNSDSITLPKQEPEKGLHFQEPDSQGTGETVEKFLAASIVSPRIATPMDDPGFSKVPGYVPSVGMPSLQEVATLNEEDEDAEQWEIPATNETQVDQEGQTNPIQSSTVFSDITPPGTNHNDSVTSASNVPERSTPNQIETDCVMMLEKSKGDVQATAGLGAITVSFPVQEKAQPMDTTTSLPEAPAELSIPLASTGARPKENTQRKSRPNSLLGLSKPDLNITVPVSSTYEYQDSGYSETATGAMSLPGSAAGSCLDQAESSATSSVVENSHDIINRQLAQKAKSPLQKQQLNLEIKQHLDNAAAHRQMENKMLDSCMGEDSHGSVGAVSVVTNRAQLASGIGITLPSEGSPLVRSDSGLQEDIMSSSSSSSLISMQAPSPARAVNVQHAAVNPAADAWQQQNQQPQQEQEEQQLQVQQQEDVAEDESETGAQGSKLKRPTSLSLMPRSEFQLSQDKDSTEDDSLTGDGGYASSGGSSGHLTPFQDNEMSEPAGATASGPGAEMMYSPPEVGPGAFSPAPRCSSNVNVVITQLGKVAPRWVPDSEACNCMQCEARFTFTKRRHHCRACGKVFCSACCNLRCKLQYMDNKEARVCSKCYQDIVRAQAYERMHSPNRSPNPNNPAEYCSTIPPLQQAAASLHAPPPTVMVPVGVLRKEGSQRSREPKQVMFSDGIRPGGDLTELDGSDARIPIRRHGRSSKKVERMAAAAAAAAAAAGDSSSDGSAKSPSPKTRVKRLSEPSLRHACLIPDAGLPPVIMSTGVKGDFTLEEDPNPESIMPKIRSTEDPNPVVFAINKNLFVLVKIVNLDCCLNRVCWCFSTKGMCTVGQDEVVIVLECLPDEKTVPRDIFCHLNSVYDEASKGNTVSHLGHTIFGQSFLDSRDHCGFLYVRPTFQCVQKLLLPQPPYVFGLLLQKWETPWAKVFPVRLMLRLGAEYRYYPCPLISVRFRKPVYGEIGHTIMNLLADFRNYQYMLPQTRGVVVHMEEKKTFINFPRNRYEEVMKVITNSNDHVMALGANFSTDADSHLVCIQNEDGNYQTQAINIQNKPRKVTGASFVVFNGALKTSSGLRAKSSIVEDGLMVQITSESMAQLKAALLDMKDYTISCGALDVPVPDEQVIVQWVEDDRKVNQGVKSPIDGLPMDGIESIHIHNGTDYVGDTRTIRWTEVFFIQNEDSSSPRCEPVDLSRLAETLAQACCIALTSHLDKLREAGLTKLGLRCTIDRDKVGYEIGANNERLPDNYMNDLDNELIPVIHNAGSQNQDGPVVLELIFYIIE